MLRNGYVAFRSAIFKQRIHFIEIYLRGKGTVVVLKSIVVDIRQICCHYVVTYVSNKISCGKTRVNNNNPRALCE